MKKDLYDFVSRLAPVPSPENPIPRTVPAVEVSEQMAICLDTLMNTVGGKINMTPSAVLEGVLVKGIRCWLDELPETDRTSIGISTGSRPVVKPIVESMDETDEEDHMAIRAQQAQYARMTESLGYTPLTTHAMSPGNGKPKENRSSSPSNGSAPRTGRKKRNRSHAKKNRNGAGAGGRTRRSAEFRSQS